MQILLNGLATGAEYALLAGSYSLLFISTNSFTFSYGATLTSAAYLLVLISRFARYPLLLGAVLAVVFGAAFAMLLERILFGPLRSKGGKPLTEMLISIGLYTVIVNVLALVFGDSAYAIHVEALDRSYHACGGYLTGGQLASMGTSAVFCFLLVAAFYSSNLGLRLRAVEDNEELAASLGVDGRKLVLACSLIAGGGAAVAGLLLSINTAVTPHMGFRPLLMAMIASMIGGRKRVEKVILSGMALGMLGHLVIWTLSSQWQDPIVFGLMTVVIAVRGMQR